MSGHGTATSGELVELARVGDAAAWDALVARYHPMLWSIARAHGLSGPAAEDVVQTTWLRLVQHLGALRSPDGVGGWLATTCRRECLPHAAVPAPREPLDLPDPAPGPEPVAEARDRLARVAAALETLSEPCRRMLRLLAAATPYAEVAAALGLPRGAIGPARARCLHALTTALGDRADTS
ncbi:sigma-70 family RNA polymerase sigma factor [Actinocorallia sp. A-T 12471]|uniref:RNA polymerase sigma factor n=1 Tax=Actinocorallia sp. A-T 12471 TaxID=3089813 RepID=UPI0029D189BE|nr:sigma-70 family RNA polymerase sigma factor [Actinocorallia sp. A-T 12471]MDX6739848.1 sigma-70 family RNA polymerase sigma factor [Actinocorallia sp. A-T 12471]